MTEKPKRELMARLRARRQLDGWARVEVWIPKALVPKLRAWVKRATDRETDAAARAAKKRIAVRETAP